MLFQKCIKIPRECSLFELRKRHHPMYRRERQPSHELRMLPGIPSKTQTLPTHQSLPQRQEPAVLSLHLQSSSVPKILRKSEILLLPDYQHSSPSRCSIHLSRSRYRSLSCRLLSCKRWRSSAMARCTFRRERKAPAGRSWWMLSRPLRRSVSHWRSRDTQY